MGSKPLSGGDSLAVCSFCPAGTFSNDTGASSPSACAPCSPNFYSAAPGQAQCTVCDAGTMSTLPGAKSRDECTPCHGVPITDIFTPDYEINTGVADMWQQIISTCAACLAVVGAVVVYFFSDQRAKRLDCYFSSSHTTEKEHYVVNEETKLGGMFSVATIVAQAGLVALLTVQYFTANALVTNALVANSVPTATCAVLVRANLTGVSPHRCFVATASTLGSPLAPGITVHNEGFGLDSPLALHAAMSPDGVCVVEGRAGPGSGNPQFASIPDTAQVRFGMRSPAPTSATVVVRVSSGIGYNPSSMPGGPTLVAGEQDTTATVRLQPRTPTDALAGTSKCDISLWPSEFSNQPKQVVKNGFIVGDGGCHACSGNVSTDGWGVRVGITRSVGSIRVRVVAVSSLLQALSLGLAAVGAVVATWQVWFGWAEMGAGWWQENMAERWRKWKDKDNPGKSKAAAGEAGELKAVFTTSPLVDSDMDSPRRAGGGGNTIASGTGGGRVDRPPKSATSSRARLMELVALGASPTKGKAPPSTSRTRTRKVNRGRRNVRPDTGTADAPTPAPTGTARVAGRATQPTNAPSPAVAVSSLSRSQFPSAVNAKASSRAKATRGSAPQRDGGGGGANGSGTRWELKAGSRTTVHDRDRRLN